METIQTMDYLIRYLAATASKKELDEKSAKDKANAEKLLRDFVNVQIREFNKSIEGKYTIVNWEFFIDEKENLCVVITQLEKAVEFSVTLENEVNIFQAKPEMIKEFTLKPKQTKKFEEALRKFIRENLGYNLVEVNVDSRFYT